MSVSQVIRALACAALVSASISVQAHESDGSIRALQESLLSWSASDFAAHGSKPEEVRNVHVRYVESDSGERSYMLCGQFLAHAGKAKATWTQFATIKTDPYEQWIGVVAEAYCERAMPISAEATDLSSALLDRLNSSAVADEQR